MKKIVYLILLSFVGAIALSSCHRNDEPEPEPKAHTVVLYFPWSGLLGYINQNIDSIKSSIVAQGGMGDNRVMLLMATNTTHYTLSEITFNGTTCQQEQLKTYANENFTSTDMIRQMLDDVARYASTPSYSMIIGAHGSGWLPKANNKIHRAIGVNSSNSELKIDIDQLDSAIVMSGIKHLNYICFDDCYMANIETAYQLKDCTDYLIASTCEVMNAGMPYHEVWKYLMSPSPNYTAITTEFNQFYLNYTYDGTAYPYGALSVTDCRQLESIVEPMSRLNELLSQAGIDITTLSPQTLDGYTPHKFFDMQDYTNKALAAIGGNDELASLFNTFYSNAIIAHTCTPYIYSEVSGNGRVFKVESNCGLTISDPTTNTTATPHLASTTWWKATHR